MLSTEHQLQLQKPIEHFHEELGKIRGGRATPMLVEHLTVEAYGAKTPLVHLASIHTPEPQTIVIEPWDKNILKDVERAIEMSSQGLHPVVDGHILRISIPPLTEEHRLELTKMLNRKTEEARVGVRGIREELLKEQKEKEKSAAISEDEYFRFEKELQTEVERVNDEIKKIADKKEQEILTI